MPARMDAAMSASEGRHTIRSVVRGDGGEEAGIHLDLLKVFLAAVEPAVNCPKLFLGTLHAPSAVRLGSHSVIPAARQPQQWQRAFRPLP